MALEDLSIDPKKSRLWQELVSTVKKAGSDVVDNFTGAGENIARDLGIVNRRKEAQREAAAKRAAVIEFNGWCFRLTHWLQLLLGTKRVKVPKSEIGKKTSKLPMGVTQVLESDKFEFENEDINKVIEELEGQKNAIEGLLIQDDETIDDADKKKNRTFIGKQPLKYQSVLNRIVECSNTGKPKPGTERKNQLTKIDTALKRKRKELEKSADLINEYNILKKQLEDTKKQTVNFISQFYSKSVGPVGAVTKFESKTDKIMTESVEEESSPETIIGASSSAFSMVNNQINQQMRKYKTQSEILIDAFIDFHRFFEENKHIDVIDQFAQTVILNVRRANKSNYFKEAIDSSGKLLKTIEIVTQSSTSSSTLTSSVRTRERGDAVSSTKPKPMDERPIRRRSKSTS